MDELARDYGAEIRHIQQAEGPTCRHDWFLMYPPQASFPDGIEVCTRCLLERNAKTKVIREVNK